MATCKGRNTYMCLNDTFPDAPQFTPEAQTSKESGPKYPTFKRDLLSLKLTTFGTMTSFPECTKRECNQAGYNKCHYKCRKFYGIVENGTSCSYRGDHSLIHSFTHILIHSINIYWKHLMPQALWKMQG